MSNKIVQPRGVRPEFIWIVLPCRTKTRRGLILEYPFVITTSEIEASPTTVLHRIECALLDACNILSRYF